MKKRSARWRAREMSEETGYELEPGAELIPLGHYFTSPGITDEHCYFFLARPVQKSAGGPQHDATRQLLIAVSSVLTSCVR